MRISYYCATGVVPRVLTENHNQALQSQSRAVYVGTQVFTLSGTVTKFPFDQVVR